MEIISEHSGCICRSVRSYSTYKYFGRAGGCSSLAERWEA